MRGTQVLDIGAHWLHQASVFRLGGYEVIAADVPITLERESVQQLAESLGIALITYEDLSVEDSLSPIESSSVDIVVMAEIIEHITFNPVELWKEIYRVMVPGGRIVLTTPNYYRTNGRAWQWRRFLSGFGEGISTHEILTTYTMGHHWKEYSLRELQHYFSMLSPDFNCVKAEYTNDGMKRAIMLQRIVKWLSQGIHLEVELTRKYAGIVITPNW